MHHMHAYEFARTLRAGVPIASALRVTPWKAGSPLPLPPLAVDPPHPPNADPPPGRRWPPEFCATLSFCQIFIHVI